MKILEIKNEITKIKVQRKKCYTNYYNQWDDKQEEEFQTIVTDNTIVFLYQDIDIVRVYFFSNDSEDLGKVLAELDQECVIDYITKDKLALRDLFVEAKFDLYVEYQRFGQHIHNVDPVAQSDEEDKKRKAGILRDDYGEVALVSDAPIILARLRQLFDPVESHFFDLVTLEEMIEKKWVWVTKVDGKIVTAYLFTITGIKKYGNFMYNDGDASTLYSVLNKADKWIAKQGVTYAYCWMDINNKKAIRYNTLIGKQKPEGVYDIIYRKEA